MSRVGNNPINLPKDVTITLREEKAEVLGPKGKMLLALPREINVEIKGNEVLVKNISKDNKAIHGLVRTLINNAVLGVSSGWSKTLQLVGVGYRAQTDGKNLTLMVGFSHSVDFMRPEGITFVVKNNDVTVSGYDKQLVGETAARIRRIKPPEIYKGKGIRYKEEVIHLKPGKAAKTVGVGTGGAK